MHICGVLEVLGEVWGGRGWREDVWGGGVGGAGGRMCGVGGAEKMWGGRGWR